MGSLLVGLYITIFAHPLFAEETAPHSDTTIEKSEKGHSIGFKAIAAALAVGLSALASGLAQARIGAAAAGALAEKPELVGSVIILEAIPETMIILGFVVAVLIIFVL
ncbi:MAG: hypothetical protein HYS08_01890 [Chlamydiae bacterium]|nr:hypothetical protein [Chlamydiota bacterium]MBI3266834.1 hypothetical protein [Chlamydiota bacterium]